jgi:hypothetical protein
VTREETIDRINELLRSTDPETANTSMRIPKALREAAALAVSELGVAPSTTILTSNALRTFLEGTGTTRRCRPSTIRRTASIGACSPK